MIRKQTLRMIRKNAFWGIVLLSFIDDIAFADAQRPWFLPVMWIGVILIVGITIILWIDYYNGGDVE